MFFTYSKLVSGSVPYFQEKLPYLSYEDLDWLNGRLFDSPKKMELLQRELERRAAEAMGVAA